MQDPALVFIVTADSDGTSNAIVAKGPILISKVVLEGDGSNALRADVYDAASITGTPKIGVSANSFTAAIFAKYTEATFNPPVKFQTGLSIDLTGNGGTCRVYYSR